MHIPTFLIAAAIVVLLFGATAVLVMLRPRHRTTQSGAQAYESVDALLTPAERSFFGVLKQAVGSDYQIFAKVRLADIVKPVRNSSRSGWQSAFNRICGKHVDFVLCDLASLSVVAVIELDDRTHERFERGFRDDFVNSALADAGILVLRVKAAPSYSPAKIREQIKNLCPSNEGQKTSRRSL